MSTATPTGYNLALPPPWARIGLDDGAEKRVQGIVDRVAAEHTPKEVPPDQVGPKKRELVQAMMQQIRQARDNGGIDLYIPLADIHGYTVQASFVVSRVIPAQTVEADEVPQVMASMLRDADSRPVSVADTVWVRRAHEVPPQDADSLASRRVEYFTAVPGEPRHWVVSSFTTAGEPITSPDSDDDMLIELFDAIMTTWRWQYDVVGRD